MTQKPHLCIILGIRPDVIRASIFLNLIREDSRVKVTFIWSGQHYSDNLKDIFFKELGVKDPEIELGASGTNDAEVSSSIISKLYPVLERLKPDAAMFLGDTNTVISCIAAAQLNIPIIHFEGLMRSYDWRMPEEHNRRMVDHISDYLLAPTKESKQNLLNEKVNGKIYVTGNTVMDAVKEHIKILKELKIILVGLALEQIS